MALWRDFDRAGLDAELNLRARTPEHVDYFARWAAESAELRRRLSAQEHVAYGTGDGETLDLFLPKETSAPLLIFIHGGYWQSLDKGDFSFLAPAFIERGIAFASLNYTLAPDASIGQMVEEVGRAVAWLRENADRYGLDPARFGISGHSAGGHLACMVFSGDQPSATGHPPLRFCCSVSGIYQLEPLRHSYHQEVLNLDAESAAALSPQAVIPSGPLGPLLLAVGQEEPGEFVVQQSEHFAAWTAAGHDGQALVMPCRHHFSAVEALSEAGHPLYSTVCDLFIAQTG